MDDDDQTREEDSEVNEMFWSMMNTENEEQCPTNTLKTIANMDMNATKEMSQLQYTDMEADTSAQSIKEPEKIEHPAVAKTPNREPATETPEVRSADKKISTDNSGKSTRKTLTWTEILTAAVPNKLAEWAKFILTQLCPWEKTTIGSGK